ncbi:hypothetical protein ACFV9C_41615 [Kribbella sp. NPDC059898]|uniref:hypothetical protein n=1 Tax=Kribbella sp. NPDC059898 TaxID=3346995 RepID=UPI00366107CC
MTAQIVLEALRLLGVFIAVNVLTLAFVLLSLASVLSAVVGGPWARIELWQDRVGEIMKRVLATVD